MHMWHKRILCVKRAGEKIGFNYRVCVPTFGAIVYECCKVLWERLVPIYMKLPQDSGEWELVAANFGQKWDFPYGLGALDGTNVVMKAPRDIFHSYCGFGLR